MQVATKVRVLKGRYRSEEIANVVFPLVKTWQAGKAGGFVTVPAAALGATGNSVRLKCEYEDLTYYNNNDEEISIPPLSASLPNGQPSPAMFMQTGGVTAPLKDGVDTPSVEVSAPVFQTLEERYLSDETEEEAMNRIQDTFNMLEEITESTASGIIRGLVVSGPPGVGKSHGVVKTLSEMPETVRLMSTLAGSPMFTKFNFEIIKGYASPIALYQILYLNRHEGFVTVFDDCDSVMFDEDALNLLKGALDSSDERHISWNSESKVLEREDIPKKFEFKGSVIFLTNLNFESTRGKIGEHMSAIMSRCHYLDLEIGSRRDQLLRIKQVVRDGMLRRYDFDSMTEERLMSYILENEEYLRELSLRMVIKIADLVKADVYNWEPKAEMTCLKREARLKRLYDERQQRRELEQEGDITSTSSEELRDLIAG